MGRDAPLSPPVAFGATRFRRLGGLNMPGGRGGTRGHRAITGRWLCGARPSGSQQHRHASQRRSQPLAGLSPRARLASLARFDQAICDLPAAVVLATPERAAERTISIPSRPPRHRKAGLPRRLCHIAARHPSRLSGSLVTARAVAPRMGSNLAYPGRGAGRHIRARQARGAPPAREGWAPHRAYGDRCGRAAARWAVGA